MRKLHIWLPLSQVVLATVLTASNFLRQDTLSNPSWRAFDRQLCDGLNAPAALIRFLLLKALDKWMPNHPAVEFVIETALYLVLIALLWYIVSLEIGASDNRGLSVLSPRMGPRRVMDLLFVLFGIALGISGGLVRHQFGYVTTYSNLVSMPYFLWMIVFIAFYARDLWLSF